MHLKLDKTLPSWERRLLVFRQLEHPMPFPTLPIELSRLATNYRSPQIWSVPLRAFDFISVACLYKQSMRQEWLINGEAIEDQEGTNSVYYRQLYNALREGLRLDDRLLAIESDPTLQELIERRVSVIDLISTNTQGFNTDKQLCEIGQDGLAYRIESIRAIQRAACELLLKLIVSYDQLICEYLAWPVVNSVSVEALRDNHGFKPILDIEPPPRPMAK